MKKQKLTALILLVVMLLSILAGCKKNDDDEQNPDDGNASSDPNTPQFVYHATFSSVDMGEVNYIQNTFYYDGKFYFYGNFKTGTETSTYTYTDVNGEEKEETYTYDTYGYGVYSMNTDGTGLTKLFDIASDTNETSEDFTTQTGSYVYNFGMDNNGKFWALENEYTQYFDVPEDFDPETDQIWNYQSDYKERYNIIRYADDGTVADKIDLYDKLNVNTDNGYFYVNNVKIDNDGNIYITSDMIIYIVKTDDSILTVDMSNANINWVNDIIVTGKGQVYCTAYTGEGFSFIEIKPDGTLGENISADNYMYNTVPGDENYDLYYEDNYNFCGYNIETGEKEVLFNWVNCDVDSDYLSGKTVMPDGSVMAISYTWNDDYSQRSYELINVALTDRSTIPQKTTLSFACMYLDYNVRRQIIKFNKSNENYRIEVQDYSQYNTEEDYTAGYTKLAAEILAGNVPDMFATGSLPMSRFAARGLLEDLWPWIDEDTDIGGRSGLVEPVFNALTNEDGGLYQIVSTFYINTVAGRSEIVGDKMGWTLQEFYDAYSKMPEGASIFYDSMTRGSMLETICSLSLGEFADWNTGECNFDTQEFMDILNFVKMFPEEFDWDAYYGEGYVYVSDIERFQTGKQMLNSTSISDLYDLVYLDYTMGGDFTFVGYPTAAGNGSAFTVDNGIAMSSTCKDKDGAWEFMKIFLSEDYQTSNAWSLPTNKAVFDKKVEEANTVTYYTDGDGVQHENVYMTWWIDENNQLEITHVSDELIAKFMELLNTTENVYEYDESLYDIILDECGAFFAGQKSVEETVKLVQSRARIYVNEQR